MTPAKQLQHIPVIRHTQADLYAAELEVIRRVKQLHGEQHEPGLIWVRETALRLLDEGDTAPKTIEPANSEMGASK